MTNRLRLILKSSMGEIGTLSEAFEAFAEKHDLPLYVRSAAHLALEEIVTNVIVHGCRGREDQAILVEAVISSGELQLCVEDSTPPFNPLQIPPPDLQTTLDEREPGGLGIHLVRKMMDRLEYDYVDGKNKLTMSKKLVGAFAQETLPRS